MCGAERLPRKPQSILVTQVAVWWEKAQRTGDEDEDEDEAAKGSKGGCGITIYRGLDSVICDGHQRVKIVNRER